MSLCVVLVLAALCRATPVIQLLPRMGISWDNADEYIDLTMHITGPFCASWAPSVHGMSGNGVTGYVTPTQAYCADFNSYDTDIRPTSPRATLRAWSHGAAMSNVTCRLPKRLYAIRDGPQRVITSMSAFDLARLRSLPHVERDTAWREVFVMDVVAGTVTHSTYRNGVFVIPIAVFAGVVLLIGIASRLCRVVLTPRRLLAAKVVLVVLFLAAVAAYMILAGLPYPTLTSVMYAMGEGTMMLTGLVMFPITKFFSVALWTYGTSFERMVPWHVLIAVVLLTVGLVHGILAFVTIGIQEPEGLAFLRRGWLGRGNVYPIPGIISLVFLVVLAIPAFLRQFAYTFFRYSHALIVLYIVFAILHYPFVGIAIAPTAALYLLDVVWRIVPTLRHGTATVVSGQARGDVVELRIASPWSSVEAGQYALLARTDCGAGTMPHPFTIARFDPETKEATFYIKRGGAWTTALYEGLADKSIGRVMCQGPYGTLMVPVEACDRTVVFAGGIGVTPMFSIAEAAVRAGKPMRFVWVVRDADAVAQVAHLLRHLRSLGAETVLEINATSREQLGLDGASLGGANVIKGRPDVAAIIAEEAGRCEGLPLGVYTCGPQPLMGSVEAAASARPKCLLHMETFEF